MILVDANLLVYAVHREAPQHEPAMAWLERRLGGQAKVGLPWPSLLAFLRLTTNPRVLSRPLAVDAAWAQVRRWLAAPTAWIPLPTERHAEILGELLAQTPGADLVPDAHLAALAVEHGLTLCSTDGDFARFDSLLWEDPLKTPRSQETQHAV